MLPTYINGHFSFPPNFDFNILPCKDIPCTVISVIGEADLFTCLNKMEIFEDITEKSMIPMNLEPYNLYENEGTSYLSGYFSEKLRIVFIHLRSINESEIILNRLKKTENQKESVFDFEDQLYLKLVVYLFLISDFVVINIIGLSLDPYYVQLLTQANYIRKRLKNITELELKTISNSAEVNNNGRLIQSRLLFIFNPPYSPLIEQIKKNPQQRNELRDRLEDKIYAYLRHFGVIGMESSIGRIHTHKPFVFVKYPEKYPSKGVADLMHKFSLSSYDKSILKNEEFEATLKEFEVFILDQIHVLQVITESSSCLSESVSCRSWFKACHKLYNLFCSDKLRVTEFIAQYRNIYYSKSYELGLSLAESRYKDGLPNQYSRDIHCEKTKIARQVLLTAARGPGILSTMKKLEKNLNKAWDVGRQICEAISVTGQRCKNEVHKLPSDYNDEYDSADDPDDDDEQANEIVEQDMEEGDTTMISTKSKQSKSRNLPIMHHNSEVQLVAACNCGRRQATRKDPFDYKESNYMFYEQMNDICCFRFNRMDLPENILSIPKKLKLKVMQKSASINSQDHNSEEITKSNKKSTKEEEGEEEEGKVDQDLDRDLEYLSENESKNTDFHSNEDYDDEDDDDNEEGLMLARRHRRSSNSDKSSDFDDYVYHSDFSMDNNDNDDDNNDYNVDNNNEKEKLKPDPYLQQMLDEKKSLFNGMYTNSDLILSAPKYSSWSLIDSGPYFSYTHATGLEYSGFVHGSNFLLPWDIPLKTKINVVRRQRVKKAFAAGNFLKAFFGYEMECPVGHRFFMAGPRHMMAGSMGAHQVKEAVNELLTRSIPLYFPCQCGQYLAQLARLYIATPHNNGLLRIYLEPRVKPGKTYYDEATNKECEVPIFMPGDFKQETIELEPGRLWVLRFPFAYEKNGRVFKPPATNDLHVLNDYQLLSGCIVYEEIFGKEFTNRNVNRGYGGASYHVSDGER